MLVPSMCPQEIKQELMKDKPWLNRKMDALWTKLRRMAIKSRTKDLSLVVETESPRKNKWLINFEFNKKICKAYLTAYFYDKRGLRAFGYSQVAGDDTCRIIMYNTHFLKRYNERLKLDISHPLQLLKHLVTHNTMALRFGRDYEEGNFFGVMNVGIGLGIVDDDSAIYEMKTFITFDMLYDEQIQLTERLRCDIQMQLVEQLQEHKRTLPVWKTA